MILISYFVLIILGLINSLQSLQSGYTCETSVTLTCPESTNLIILEVTYSSECPGLNEEKNGGSLNAPSRCIGYYKERASNICNGQQTCIIDNNLEQRPSFFIGKQANCQFTGQSINIDYSCVPTFYSSRLPRIDICSLQSLHDVKEGFIHTPNYPNGYPNSRTCSKTIPSPDTDHRLKIYALDFDIEGLSVLRFFGITRVNDWLQINNSGEKMFGIRSPYTLLFDDIIEASLMFKSDFANTKRPYKGFLLYFIIVPIRTYRPTTSTTTTSSTTTTEKPSTINPNLVVSFLSENVSTSLIEPKSSALVSNERQQNNIGLTLLVILLSSTLVIILCVFILYKRRNDRRIRYLTNMFNSFFPTRTKNIILNTTDNNNDETILNNTKESKIDVSLTNNNEKYIETSKLKHENINEKRDNQEKEIFIENLKISSSPYSSYRRSQNKFNSKEQINLNSNIYSQDPLVKTNSLEKINQNNNNNNNNSLFYEYVDLNQQEEEQQPKHEQQQQQQQQDEEVIYDVINSNNERSIHQDTDYDSVMYATPKNS